MDVHYLWWTIVWLELLNASHKLYERLSCSYKPLSNSVCEFNAQSGRIVSVGSMTLSYFAQSLNWHKRTWGSDVEMFEMTLLIIWFSNLCLSVMHSLVLSVHCCLSTDSVLCHILCSVWEANKRLKNCFKKLKSTRQHPVMVILGSTWSTYGE